MTSTLFQGLNKSIVGSIRGKKLQKASVQCLMCLYFHLQVFSSLRYHAVHINCTFHTSYGANKTQQTKQTKLQLFTFCVLCKFLQQLFFKTALFRKVPILMLTIFTKSKQSQSLVADMDFLYTGAMYVSWMCKFALN